LRINDGFKKQLLEYEMRLFPDRTSSIDFVHARVLRSNNATVRATRSASASTLPQQDEQAS
jgi:hypothetical protein